MNNDTRDPASGNYGLQFKAEVLELSKHKSYRSQGRKWARNLRFLALDDGREWSTSQHIATQEPGRLLCGLEQSESGPEPGNSNNTPKRDPCPGCVFTYESGSRAACCDHRMKRSCADCQKCPLFPTDGKATNFRIVQFRDPDVSTSMLSTCDHYVAVSYCWPPATFNDAGAILPFEGPYTVRMLDGTKRKSKAPTDVIDRAVAFAAQNSIRLIWIDQECINQDDTADKLIGIQNMDIVYERAYFSIGLFSVFITSQAQIDALAALDFWAQNGYPELFPCPRSSPTICDFAINLMEVLELLVSDRWTERAWILQESFSAGQAMALLFKTAEDLSKYEIGPPSSPLAFSWEFTLNLDTFINCLSYAQIFYGKNLYSPSLSDFYNLYKNRVIKLGSRMIQFHPISPDITHKQRSTGDRPNKLCNAAVALTFLQTRHNTIVSDRLAIIANLCNYEIRLDITNFDQSNRNLSTCILIQAVLNGDLSLLYPEMYSSTSTRKVEIGGSRANIPPILSKSGAYGMSWAIPFRERLPHVDAKEMDPLTRAAPRNLLRIELSSHGLTLPGVMWKVGKKVELYGIKARFANEWSDLQSTKSSVPYARLMCEILIAVIRVLHLGNKTHIADAIWQSIRREESPVKTSKGCLVRQALDPLPDSVKNLPEELLPGEESEIIQLNRIFNAPPGGTAFRQSWVINQIIREGFLWVGQLVTHTTDILDPESEAEKEEYELELHKSHTKCPICKCVNGGRKCRNCDAHLDDAHNIEDNPKAKDHSNCPNCNNKRTERFICDQCSKQIPDGDTRYNCTICNLGNYDLCQACVDYGFMCLGQGEHELIKYEKRETSVAQVEKEDKPSNILVQQSVTAMITGMLNNTYLDSNVETNAETIGFRDPGAFAALLQLVNEKDSEEQNDEKSALPRAAVFDVAGPCTIFTPYDSHLEILPRPSARAMSISWIVEKDLGLQDKDDNSGQARQGNEEAAQKDTMELLKPLGMVKGMWKIMTFPRTRYTLV